MKKIDQNKYRSKSGYTMIETMISMALMLVILSGMTALILNNQRQHIRETLKREMVSDTRNFQSFFNTDLRNAGSVLTLLHTPTFLGVPGPFNGILPLNNADFPDGVILASGDQLGITELTADFTANDTTVNVSQVDYIDQYSGSTEVAWMENDVGLVIRKDGFLVFRVTRTPSIGDTSLLVRSEPVYYSGLLNTANYNDFLDDQLGANGLGTYTAGSPVIRLNYFHIYLTRIDTDKEGGSMMTLTITTDTKGEADLMGVDETDTIGIRLIENIVDFQLEYMGQDGVLWANLNSYSDPCSSPTAADCVSFREQIINRNLGSIHVYLMTETERDRSIVGSISNLKWNKPVMGDSQALVNQPEERRRRIYYEFEISPRNFRIVY